jgi:hypothetical protein
LLVPVNVVGLIYFLAVIFIYRRDQGKSGR